MVNHFVFMKLGADECIKNLLKFSSVRHITRKRESFDAICRDITDLERPFDHSRE